MSNDIDGTKTTPLIFTIVSSAAREDHVRQSEFGKSSPQIIERPTCPKCENRMMLSRIEPDKPDHDKRTFECFDCDHSESIVVKYQ